MTTKLFTVLSSTSLFLPIPYRFWSNVSQLSKISPFPFPEGYSICGQPTTSLESPFCFSLKIKIVQIRLSDILVWTEARFTSEEKSCTVILHPSLKVPETNRTN